MKELKVLHERTLPGREFQMFITLLKFERAKDTVCFTNRFNKQCIVTGTSTCENSIFVKVTRLAESTLYVLLKHLYKNEMSVIFCLRDRESKSSFFNLCVIKSVNIAERCPRSIDKQLVLDIPAQTGVNYTR